jgi:multisubunit Na+/H+ antiporter MnhG subunit
MVVLGVISLLTASLATGDPEFIYRVVLIGVFLILSAPVSAHLIARAARHAASLGQSSAVVGELGTHLVLTGRQRLCSSSTAKA